MDTVGCDVVKCESVRCADTLRCSCASVVACWGDIRSLISMLSLICYGETTTHGKDVQRESTLYCGRSQ